MCWGRTSKKKRFININIDLNNIVSCIRAKIRGEKKAFIKEFLIPEGDFKIEKIIEILEAFIKKGETKDELAGGIFVLRDKDKKITISQRLFRVEAPVARCPPRRSLRAVFPHTAFRLPSPCQLYDDSRRAYR